MARGQGERAGQRGADRDFLTGDRPFTPVFWLGNLLIPLRTEFPAVNEVLRVLVANVSPPAAESRLSKATSEGELSRVGTFPLGGIVESSGKTR